MVGCVMCAQSSERISICQWMSILVAFRWIVNEQYNNSNNDQVVHSRFKVNTAIVIRRMSNLATLYTLFMLIFIGSGYLFAYLHWNGIVPFRHMLIWIIYDFLDIAWNVLTAQTVRKQQLSLYHWNGNSHEGTWPKQFMVLALST